VKTYCENAIQDVVMGKSRRRNARVRTKKKETRRRRKIIIIVLTLPPLKRKTKET